MDGRNNFPKLHNAMWPGLVGKGPDSEPPIDLDTMLDLTAKADVGGIKFDGVDLFLFEPHTSIDLRTTTIKRLADKVRGEESGKSARWWRRCGRRSAAARRWGAKRTASSFVDRCARPAALAGNCASSASGSTASFASIPRRASTDWAKDPPATHERSPTLSGEACDVAEDHGERLAAEGEICWGGMHSWKTMVELLEQVEPAEDARLPGRHGAHAALYARLQRARRRASCPRASTGRTRTVLDQALKTLTDALRPWTIDFHVAQNDATVKGIGHARQDRPSLPGQRPQRQARHRARRRLLAARRRRASPTKPSTTSAGTAACFRTR